MTFRFWAVAATLVIVAVPAHAQGGGRGRDNESSRVDKPHVVTSDSVERLNPISPLIARRRELGIPDSLIGKLGAILSRLDVTNARALRQIDSLAASGGSPRESGDATSGERPPGTVSLDLLIGEISKHNDTAAQDALNLLSGQAASRALKVVNDQRNKLQRLLMDSGFGRREF
jgi:hypothetical protein